MMKDSFINRIKAKARANQLCIAVGTSFSDGMGLPTMAHEICSLGSQGYMFLLSGLSAESKKEKISAISAAQR
jgi:hypothetical protein